MTKHKRKKDHQPAPAGRPSALSRNAERALLAAVGIGFWIHCAQFKFVQDDSFITFRYVRNFLDGHGLVFNIGERVEGYTTFLWTILLALPGKFGVDLIDASQILGIIAGVAALYVLFLLSRGISGPSSPPGLTLIAVALTAANSSVAFWTSSGMETPLFTLLLLWAVYAYLQELRRSGRFLVTPALFVLLSLTRPEGMLLFGLTFLHYIVVLFRTRPHPFREQARHVLLFAAIYVLPMLVFTAWRLAYYGYLFPNTYYAKAGFSTEYMAAGLDYATSFARMYLLHGSLLAVPVLILLWKQRTAEILYLIGLTLGYALYVIAVGGDVLHAFRFFVPFLPVIYLLLQEALHILLRMIPTQTTAVRALPLAAALLIGYTSFTRAYDYVREKWMLEVGLVTKMSETGAWLREHASPSTVVAASTIGAVAYYAGVPLIDMLGLTDATIAHHPEYVEGIQSGWKERKYNNTYLLGRKPEWILFSTGIKPSAFAERALFTQGEFRLHYYPYYFHLGGDFNSANVAYRRSPVPLVDTTQFSATIRSVDFINNFYDGMNRLRYPTEALQYFARALQSAPQDFALLHQELAGVHRSQNSHAAAEEAYRRAAAINPAMMESQIMLGVYARSRNDLAEARHRFEQVVQYNPDYSVGWTLLGENCMMTGDTLRARGCFQKALELAPNNNDAHSALARLTRAP